MSRLRTRSSATKKGIRGYIILNTIYINIYMYVYIYMHYIKACGDNVK